MHELQGIGIAAQLGNHSNTLLNTTLLNQKPATTDAMQQPCRPSRRLCRAPLTLRSGNGGAALLFIGTREVTREMHLPSAKQLGVSAGHWQLTLHTSPVIPRHTCSMEGSRGEGK